jgi:hypothetical protein
VPGLIDLQAAQNREIEMATTNEPERHCAVERARARERRHWPPARVGQHGVRHALLGRCAGADKAVLGLEEDMHALWNIIRDESRNSDAEVHKHARRKLAGSPAGDNALRVHGHLTRWQ